MDERPERDILRLVGELLALSAVLLPIEGGLVRAIAIAASGSGGNSVLLGWSSPLPFLVTTGAFAIVAPCLFIILWFFAVRSFPDDEAKFDERERPVKKMAFKVIATLIIGSLIVWYPHFPDFLLNVFCALVVISMLERRRKKIDNLKFGDLWLVILVVFTLSAVPAGLSGSIVGIDVGNYHFTPSAQLSSGSYELLGNADGLIYLEPCIPRSSKVIAVSTSEVAWVTQIWGLQEPRRPSLWQIVIGHRPSIEGIDRC